MEILLGPLPKLFRDIWEIDTKKLLHSEYNAESVSKSEPRPRNLEETQRGDESVQSPSVWFKQANNGVRLDDQPLWYRDMMEMRDQDTRTGEGIVEDKYRDVGDYEIWDGNMGQFAKLSDLFDDTVLSQY